ncbi:MAG TPA: RT0821/Lpp0805 family surface protein [Rhizobiaceae bacterium]|nr:RT0821/Lpp0805 family surface protein [Rhizobiaceae bacterium]
MVLCGLRAAALACLFAFGGCAGGGLDLSKAEADPTLITGSVQNGAMSPSSTRLSDEATIRNAVSSADVEAAAAQPLAWANTDTGSRGAITKLIERKEEKTGLLCRSFTALRESFDGVGLFSGDACRTRTGDWQMRTFKPL